MVGFVRVKSPPGFLPKLGAYENGFKKAKIGKDAIRKRMTSSQKEEANSLAREWLKNHRD